MDADLCIHCKLPIPPEDLVVDTIDGEERHFCCNGCLGVYRIINGAGMQGFYKRRDWQDEGVPQGVFDSRFDDTALADRVITRNDSTAEIALMIEGVRCAACVWLLERLVGREEGVRELRINYATHRARVTFNPRQTSAARVLAAVSRLGYLPRPFSPGAAQQSAAREQRSLLIRFGTAAFLSLQLMGFSFALYGGYFHGIEPQIRQMIQYLAAAVTTPVVFYAGWPFLSGALRSLRNRSPGMDILISLGVLTAYGYSIYVLFRGGEVYFDSAAMIVTLILLGRLFEGAARSRSVAGIDKLLQLAPETATRLCDNAEESVPSATLRPGETILVRPGERIPVDATILAGETELDESSISGEPLPVLRRTGDRVSAGSMNLITAVRLQVERIAADSFIARMARLVEEAQSRRAPIQSLADRVAAVFVPFVTLVAGSTWVWWLLGDAPPREAILNAVAVLIVACPCALGLATPTAILVATGAAAGNGILFRGGDILERCSRIKLVAFDKTGTLTHGHPAISRIIPAAGETEQSLLQLAAELEGGSTHPIAAGIRAAATARGLTLTTASQVTTLPGRGLALSDEGGSTLVGSRALLEEAQIRVPTVDSALLTEVHISRNGSWRGALLVSDPLRQDARRVVATLKEMGIETVLLTGDRAVVAEEVSRELGITHCHANLQPAQKAAWIEQQQREGKDVLMVGDGINDAPALSTAAVGCAMAGSSDIALESSDLVLPGGRLRDLSAAILISRRTLRVIRQNLGWAFAYNLVTLPLAASGQLAPVWAAAAMATSSVLVVSNSLRLSRQIKRNFSVARQAANN
jgi:Cu2+-exporting ATPase